MRYQVQADDENNAEEWWNAVRQQYPSLAKRLETGDPVEVSSVELQALTALPGWATGPSYAREALIVTEAGGI